MLPGYYGYRNMVLGFSQDEYYTYTLFYKQDYNEQYQVKTDKKPNKTKTLKLNFC